MWGKAFSSDTITLQRSQAAGTCSYRPFGESPSIVTHGSLAISLSNTHIQMQTSTLLYHDRSISPVFWSETYTGMQSSITLNDVKSLSILSSVAGSFLMLLSGPNLQAQLFTC